MLLLLACSDYEYAKGIDSLDLAGDSARPADTHDTAPADSGPVDTGPEDTAPDGFEEAYCTPFDDFDGWSYTGTGEWYVEDGLLTEGRHGSYAGIAYVGDLGRSGRFMIQVDTAWTANANDLTGIAWQVNGEEAWVARWDDPQGYYGRYSPTGGMDLSWCTSGGCTPYVADSSADLYWPDDKSFVTWSVAVDGDDVAVTVNGSVVLAATVPGLAGSGPGVVGVYSNDNDGGVWFDNFCVWTGSE